MGKTLKFGGGVWATKKGSTLAYNDEDGNFKPLPFTYTGAGKGTRVNKEGFIEVVENDRPRIDYKDSEDGVFLLENAATNLVTYSEDFSNVSWANAEDAIITNNSSISPTGELNGTLFAAGNSNNFHRISHSLSISNATSYTHSIFVKKQNFNYFTFRYNLGSGGYSNVCFDLNDGILVYNGLNCTPSIEKYKDDWYRLSISFTSIGTTGTVIYYISENPITSNTITTYTGDGTSGVYIYGAMLEENSVASSYIPTQGSASTRVAETASGSGNSEVFNSQEGVFFLNTKALSNDGTTRTIGLSDGSNSNRIHFINYAVSNGYSVNYRVSNSTQVAFTEVGNVLDYQKIAFKYKSGDFSLWYNGFEIDTDDNTTMMTENTLDRLSFRQEPNSFNYYGKTKEIAYYDEILTDLELETLTSYRTWEAMVKELNLNIIHNE